MGGKKEKLGQELVQNPGGGTPFFQGKKVVKNTTTRSKKLEVAGPRPQGRRVGKKKTRSTFKTTGGAQDNGDAGRGQGG